MKRPFRVIDNFVEDGFCQSYSTYNKAVAAVFRLAHDYEDRIVSIDYKDIEKGWIEFKGIVYHYTIVDLKLRDLINNYEREY